MFEMVTAWRVSYSRASEKGSRISSVSVPAYGGGAPVVQVHAYDNHGRPIAT